ncbi:hypothetical protein [Corynebacterium oculi]|nr:hypothetical protein [Corynebacterium oculi]
MGDHHDLSQILAGAAAFLHGKPCYSLHGGTEFGSGFIVEDLHVFLE